MCVEIEIMWFEGIGNMEKDSGLEFGKKGEGGVSLGVLLSEASSLSHENSVKDTDFIFCN